MFKTAIFSPGSNDQAAQVKASPGIVSGDHVFLIGRTGSRHELIILQSSFETSLSMHDAGAARHCANGITMCPSLRLETVQGFPPLPVSCH